MQENLAAYLAGRLEGEELGLLKAHLGECSDCRELVESLEEVVRGWKSGGPELLEPCPESETVMRVATGVLRDTDGRISRHVRTCASCSLEHGYWKKDEERKAARIPRRAVSRSGLYRWAGLAAAAGLFLGLGLPALFRAPEPDWSGPVNLYTLDGTLRGEEDLPVFTVDEDQPFLPIVLIPAVPEAAAPEDRFRLVITGEEDRAVWSAEMTAGEIVEILNASGVLTLMIPAALLPQGSYTLRMSGAGDLLMEERFHIE
jgi:hypothetical protein